MKASAMMASVGAASFILGVLIPGNHSTFILGVLGATSLLFGLMLHLEGE